MPCYLKGRGEMRRFALLSLLVTALAVAGVAGASHGPGSEVTVGSDDSTPLQNKQNEPAVAVNPVNHSIVAAGANDNIDLEGCNNGSDTTCPFTEGVGVSGVQFSLDGGATWIQPTYTGYSARLCKGVAGSSADICPTSSFENGPIGTLPWYWENGLVSDGDPAVVFGPKPNGSGGFTWANGARLYYTNLTGHFSAVRSEQEFKGFEAVAVSRTDNVAVAAAGGAAGKAAWMPPVIVTKQSGATFSDKEFIYADNAESSPFFGNVYICNASFRSVGGPPEPIVFSRSTDGGDSWSTRQITPAANTNLGHGRQGCTVRTDSGGVVYVFYRGGDTGKPNNPPLVNDAIMMVRSFDGGVKFDRPRPVARTTECGLFDPVQGRLTFDGVSGARTNIGPTADIANGNPTGYAQPHNDVIVLGWCDGPTPSTTSPGPNEQAFVQWSTNRGETWSAPVNAAATTDRPDFPAVAVSPDGTDIYVTYMNFMQPWQPRIDTPARNMQGVVRYAAFPPAAFADRFRGTTGDARGSTANGLSTEFLGDYNYVWATNSNAVAVWNDVRHAMECPAIDAWRQSVVNGAPIAVPAPGLCPFVAPDFYFGNSDIYSSIVAP
jgi:hypothetical protein